MALAPCAVPVMRSIQGSSALQQAVSGRHLLNRVRVSVALVTAIYLMILFPRSSNRTFRATTIGVQEKCIDIALAVEMMHYATIPDTYDVGGERDCSSFYFLQIFPRAHTPGAGSAEHIIP